MIGRVPIAAVAAVLLLAGCCGPAVTGGLTAQLPRLVDADRLPRAFGLDSLFYNIASMAGPALVGVLAALAGSGTAQLALATAALAGALLVLTLPLAGADGPTPARGRLLGGAVEIVREPTLRVVTAASTIGQLGPGALGVVAAVLAVSLRAPAAAGLLLSVLAAGSLVGSVVWTVRPLPAARAPVVTTLAMIGTGSALAAASVLPSLWATACAFAVAGMFIGPFAAALFTVRTRYSTPASRAQVFTIGAGLKVTASAAGAALIGLATGLPPGVQLLIVASSPLLAGLVGTALLARGRGRIASRAALPG